MRKGNAEVEGSLFYAIMDLLWRPYAPVISVERMRKSDAYTIAYSIPSVEAIKDILG